MIVKYFELNKLNINETKFILLHGKNDGLKLEEILKLQKKIQKQIQYYDEKQILENKENFLIEIFNRSLFESEKLIIIKRATDKFLAIIEELIEKKPIEDSFIIDCDLLDKKSKLRNFFEKDKNQLISVAFYPDTNETLSKLAYNFLRNKKISLSPFSINFIVNKCNGDRKNLNNELKKIELLSLSKKEINDQDLAKLINLNENHSINELTDFCLAKNQKKTLNILNDNIFSNEDCIIITRTMLKKTKRLLKLIADFKINNNLEKTINNAKPPIFWKEKEITKQQVSKWTDHKVQKLIFEINDTELLLKKLPVNSINLVTNFLLEKSR